METDDLKFTLGVIPCISSIVAHKRMKAISSIQYTYYNKTVVAHI